MPEIDFTRYRVIGRGVLLEKARRSFELVLFGKKDVETLGGARGDARGLTRVSRP